MRIGEESEDQFNRIRNPLLGFKTVAQAFFSFSYVIYDLISRYLTAPGSISDCNCRHLM